MSTVYYIKYSQPDCPGCETNDKIQEGGKKKKKINGLINWILLQQRLEAERREGYSIAHEVLAHGLDPVQTKRVQHGTGAFHDAEDAHRQHEPEVEGDDDHDDAHVVRLLREGASDGHLPQDDGELLVREGEGPQTKVRGSVGDTVEAEFDGVDDLVDHCLSEFKLLVLLPLASNVLCNHFNAFAVADHAVPALRKAAVRLAVLV